MNTITLARKLVAEGLGTLLLLATVVGSGIMAENLTGGNAGLSLLANAVATAAMLIVLIWMFANLSGAHFNPAVTLSFLLQREISASVASLYMLLQVAGAIAGVWLAHLMFALPVLQMSGRIREGMPQLVSEAVATFGLVLTIFGCRNWDARITGVAVGLYIAAAYWFTASTSFANPAVTIGRSLTDTFSGIFIDGMPGFILAQFAGAVAATLLARWLFAD